MKPAAETRRGPKLKPTVAKPCEGCGKAMERRYWSSGRIETVAVFKRRKFCSRACSHGAERPERIHGYEACLMCGTVRPDSALMPSATSGWRRCTDGAWCAAQAEGTP